MSSDMEKDLFAVHTFGKVALQKIGSKNPDFRLYSAGIVGDPKTSTEMSVTGALFRRAKSGQFKGKLAIMVPRTQHTVRVTRAEMKEFESKQPKDAT